jgi:hypothetical protein
VRPWIEKALRIAFALGFFWLIGYIVWSAIERRHSWPELVAGSVGALAFGWGVLFWRKARGNRGLAYLLIGVMWASWSAANWFRNQDSMTATLGTILSAFSLWLSWMYWKIGAPAIRERGK